MTLDKAIEYHERIDKIETQACFLISQEDGDYESHKRCAEEHRQLAEWLKELKQLREQIEWIPVSERLPEDNKAYLVTVELTFARGERYVSQERKVNWDKMKECSHEIIAWMPLPEPYEPQEGASR